MIARHLRRRLVADDRGVTAVEFAVLAPVLIMLIVGAIEIGHIAMVRLTLEGAVGAAARAAAADLVTSEADRTEKMKQSIRRRMSAFPIAKDRDIMIETKVFHDFSSAYPEAYEDTNKNGRWDPGELFDDRNRNGTRDVARQITGALGGPGDVVLYSASFPSAFYFRLFADWFSRPEGIVLSSSVILRNEPEKRKKRID